MNIAMMHFRVGETDGVSLEMDKWKQILEKKGHRVYYIAGSEGTSHCHIVKELYYRDEYDAEINRACYEQLGDYDEASLAAAIRALADKIKEQFVRLFRELEINLVIPNNLLCLGRSPHIAVALTEAILETGVKVIGHHHDFYWEREYFSHPTTEYVSMLLDEYFPPRQLKEMRHVVINTPAQKALMRWKSVPSKVIPNVFDFDLPEWAMDTFNSSFKSDFGLKENQVVFLQATRVTNRKAIELAIDLMAVLNEPAYRQRMIGRTMYDGRTFTDEHELVLVLVGLHEGLEGYEDQLIAHAKDLGVNMIVKPDLVNHQRHVDGDHKVYSLWDAYVYSDMVTYPSVYEGWGNQFLEGLFAKRPQIVFEYSIFQSDIKAYGFDYISLGNVYERDHRGFATISRSQLESAANDTLKYLFNAQLYKASVDRNHEIARQHLSLDALESMLEGLFDE